MGVTIHVLSVPPLSCSFIYRNLLFSVQKYFQQRQNAEKFSVNIYMDKT